MYFTAELVYKSYIPQELKIGMLFVNRLYPGTEKEYVEIYALSSLPNDEDAFYSDNGYPIEFFLIEEGNLNSQEIVILATHDQIGWWDEGDDTDELYDVTLTEINSIFNDFDGYVSVDVDGETGEPELVEEKVILSYPYSDEEYYEDDEEEEEIED